MKTAVGRFPGRPVLFAICWACANTALAQTEDEPSEGKTKILETVHVTATRLGLSVADTPISMEVVTAADMISKLVRSMPEALAELPGVMVQKTANGQGSPYLRGFTGYRTLALIDGVRYNHSAYRDGPNEYFSLIDFHTLDRIELLEGPSAVEYGSDAIGGTLNLLTRQSDFVVEEAGQIYTHGSQHYRYSSAEDSNVARTTAEIGRGGQWGLLLGYTHEHFGDVRAAEIGTQRHTGYDDYGWDARYDLQISDHWKFTLNHQYLAQDDVWKTHSTIYALSFAGTEVGTDLRRLKDQARSLSYAKLVGTDLRGMIDEVSLTFSWQTTDEDGDRIKSNQRRTIEVLDSRMVGADLQFNSEIPIGKFVYGVDFYRDAVDSANTEYNADGSLRQIHIQGPVADDSSFSQFGAYIQGAFQLGQRMDLIAGSRFTQVGADVGRFEDPATGQPASFDKTWNNVISSLYLSYDLTAVSSWHLRAGISQSFRAPNLGDLSRYGDSRSNETEIAATDLDPEHFLTYELGIKGEEGRLSASAAVYYTQIDGYIASTPTGNLVIGSGGETLTEVTKRNSGTGNVTGLELVGSYRLVDNWAVRGNLTWLEGDLESFVDASSALRVTEPLSRVQPLTLNLAVRRDNPDKRWWGELACTMVARADRLSTADQSDTQRIPPGGTPGYVLLGLYGGYMVNEHVNVSIGLENLLDQAYRSHGSGSNEPGFGINMGITASF